MIKKVLIGSAIAVAFSAFVFGRDACSYLRTGAHSVRKAVKAEVPVEFEIERAKAEVEQIVPDIRECMHVVAEQQVELEHLTTKIAKKETELDRQKTTLLAMRNDLGTGDSNYRYAGRTYTSEEVRRDLAQRFERFKACKETLDMDRQIHRARESALKSNQEKLDGMLAAKKELEVKLEQLEARLQAVRAAETVSHLRIDDSRLNRARKLIDDLNKQLDVKEKLLDAEGKFTGLIPVEEPQEVSAEAIGQEIDQYFHAQDGKGAAEFDPASL